ncbi:MAG TPA: hypothetical protein VL069_04320 [Opitutus sp.]|nr:hypothetical protein [Opitutus sp.]
MIARTATSEIPTTRFRVWAGALGVALVLLLGAARVTPALHEWLHLHGEGHHEAQHQCAVVLFATGVTLAAGALILAAPTPAWRAYVPVAAADVLLPAPRYLRQPERGPPTG